MPALPLAVREIAINKFASLAARGHVFRCGRKRRCHTSLSPGQLAATVVGAVAFVFFLFFLLIAWQTRKRNKKIEIQNRLTFSNEYERSRTVQPPPQVFLGVFKGRSKVPKDTPNQTPVSFDEISPARRKAIQSIIP